VVCDDSVQVTWPWPDPVTARRACVPRAVELVAATALPELVTGGRVTPMWCSPWPTAVVWREPPRLLNPQAEHLLDWFHVTMRITVMPNMAKSLRTPSADPESTSYPPRDLAGQLERLKWFFWHGNVFRALQVIGDLVIDLDTVDPGPEQHKLLNAVTEFDTYIRANAASIPNYGERHRAGEAISSSFVESAVNHVISKPMVKKHQKRWAPRGAHLLLQVRTRVLTTNSPTTFTAGIPSSPIPPIDKRRPRDLPNLSRSPGLGT